MKENTLKEKITYAFDNYISKGSIRILSGLMLLSLVGVILLSIASWIFKMDPEKNIFELIWMTMMATFQSNSISYQAGKGNEESTTYIVLLIIVTFLAFMVVSIIIGAIANGIQNKIESLRKGRTLVVEKNHTVILGWSEQIFTIISELITASTDSNKKNCIVIMGDKDKIEMEDEIKTKISKNKNVRIVCRQGSSIEIADLKIVNLNNSKSIIIISPDDTEDPDSNVIKTILAITKSPNRRNEPYNIIAEIRDPQKAEIAKIVGKEELEVVLVGELISRIIAQTCRQHGLSSVYTELLDFGGVEIYFKKERLLTGKKISEVLNIYENSVIIGLYDSNNKTSKLNPPMNTVIQETDQIIVIAENENAIKLSDLKPDIDEKALHECKNAPLEAEKSLILGWNWKVTRIINELDNYVPENSLLTVVAGYKKGESIINEECSAIVKNQKIEYLLDDTTDRKVLDKLMNQGYEHVIVLCNDQISVQEADARTLVTLLHLRDIKDKTGKDFSIVSEMLDIKNRNLAEAAKANDFVVSDKLVSLLMSQLSENKQLNAVFQDLFDPDGSEIYLKPVSDYVKLNTEVNFYTVTKAAADKGEIAIGYKIHALRHEFDEKNLEKGHGIFVSPPKSKKIKFVEEDKIIVLAEHQVC